MKKSLLEKNRIPKYIVELIARLVKRIEWSERRRAMADVTLTLLEGKARIAEEVFGWGRSTVKLGIEELKSGMVCVNDLSRRRKPKTEEKCPELLRAIRLIMDPASQAQSHLRTSFSYTNVTAKSVRSTLVENGWNEAELPSVRTISNILNRQNYRLRRVEKSQVKKKRVDGHNF